MMTTHLTTSTGRGARALLAAVAVAQVLCLASAAGAGRHEDWNRLELWHKGVGATLSLSPSASSAGGPLRRGAWVGANETVVHASGDFVRVFFGLGAGETDEHRHYLALFQGYPVETEWPATPIKWKLLSEEDKRRGHVDSRMLLMGAEPLHFALVRHYDGKATLDAVSAGVTFANLDEPVGIHLAIGFEPTDLSFQWTTFKNASAGAYDPVVAVYDRADPSARHPVGTFGGKTETYARSDLCGAPANASGWVDPGLIHTVYVEGRGNLVPGRQYAYYVGNGAKSSAHVGGPMPGTWRGPFVFTAPRDPADADAVNIFAIADMGEYPDDGFNDENLEISTQPSLEVARMMISAHESQSMEEPGSAPWLMVHNGDISYARGYGAIWHSFFHMVEPLTRSMPYMTTIGNHERDWPDSGDRYGGTDSNGECGVPYMMRTPMPRRSRPGADEPWYAFEFGPISFVQMSTEHVFGMGSPQFAFVSEALAAVDRMRTPWLIVGFHRPFYIDSTFDDPKVNSSDQGVAREMRETYEDLFMGLGVDMTWAGHHHSYQRTCPVFQSKCVAKDEKAPIHVVLGHAGAGLCMNLEPKRPEYFDVAVTEHGYTRVEATRSALRMRSFNLDGKVIDEFELEPKVSPV